MIGGYMGKLLFIDLTDQTYEVQDLPEEMALQFIGGYGIGARVLYDRMKSGVDPLGPDNIIGFLPGPLTGTPALGAGRYTVVCKSPVYNGWNDANAGGYFGPEIKKAGFDGIFITGVSQKPVYVWINDGVVEIKDAAHLWGRPVKETEQIIRDELTEPKLRVASIGPAGEKLSLIAAVMNDGHRAAARGGPGAVMGSKKLKAVVVRGSQTVPVADPKALNELNKMMVDITKTRDSAISLGKYGTSAYTTPCSISGDSPLKNWAGSALVDWPEADAKKMDSTEFDQKYKKKKYSCATCALGCGAEYRSDKGEFAVGETDRPEYETWNAFGGMILNTDIESIIKCNHICNDAGLDTISAGATIAWATECYEKGMLTKEDTGGIELGWGNARAIVEATQVMADQSTAFGELLALGSRGAARKLGKGSDCLVTIEGVELGMHDPRLLWGYSRVYLLTPVPGRHTQGGLGVWQIFGEFDDPGKEDFIATVSWEIMNASGLCMFPDLFIEKNIAFKLLRVVVGRDFSEEEFIQTGTRIFNMRQAFNFREGLKPREFEVPTKRYIGDPPLETGPTAGNSTDVIDLGSQFCKNIGWDQETWIPLRQSLEELGGMEDVIQDLYA